MILLMAAAMAASGADAAIGRWKTETRNGIVEIAPCPSPGGASICGRLLTSDGLRANPDLRDANNKDASLRGRRLAGVQMLGGFTRGDDGTSSTRSGWARRSTPRFPRSIATPGASRAAWIMRCCRT